MVVKVGLGQGLGKEEEEAVPGWHRQRSIRESGISALRKRQGQTTTILVDSIAITPLVDIGFCRPGRPCTVNGR